MNIQKLVMLLLPAIGLSFFGSCIMGCTITTKGEGEYAIGFSADNYLFVRQRVQEGNEAESSSDLSVPTIEEWLGGLGESDQTGDGEGEDSEG